MKEVRTRSAGKADQHLRLDKENRVVNAETGEVYDVTQIASRLPWVLQGGKDRLETYDPETALDPLPQTPTPQNPPTPLLKPSNQLPDLKDESLRSIRVKSSDGKRYYSVNLLDYTCTCPSFLEIQSKAPP